MSHNYYWKKYHTIEMLVDNLPNNVCGNLAESVLLNQDITYNLK
jgi:hypothetical protein